MPIESIGGTPIVEIARLSPNPDVRLFAKLEAANPTGSVKDRVARALVEDLEATGRLAPDSILLEATSGNTGIALAMIGRRKGYRVAVVMPDNVTVERRALIALHGAEVIDSPGALGSNGAIALARDLVARDPRFVMADQYANPANPRVHEETTGPEILDAVPELDVFVAGLGTGGTLTGVGRFLRRAKPGVRIIAAEPLPGEAVQGLRSLDDGFVPEIFDPSHPRRPLRGLERRGDHHGARAARARGDLRGTVLGRDPRRGRSRRTRDGPRNDRRAPARRRLEVPLGWHVHQTDSTRWRTSSRAASAGGEREAAFERLLPRRCRARAPRPGVGVASGGDPGRDRRARARARRPNEACGIVVGDRRCGRWRHAARWVPLRNPLGSPFRYAIDPDDLLRLTIETDDADEVFWAIVHSHVASPARPSPTDLREAHYPDSLYLLVSLDPGEADPATGAPSVRGRGGSSTAGSTRSR